MEAMYASLDSPALVETTVAVTQNHLNTAPTKIGPAPSDSKKQSKVAADIGMEAMFASLATLCS